MQPNEEIRDRTDRGEASPKDGGPGQELQPRVPPSSPEGEKLTVDIPPQLPESIQKEVRSFFSMIGRFGPAPSPFEEKLTEDHITAIITATREDTNHGYQERREGRILVGFFSLVGVVWKSSSI